MGAVTAGMIRVECGFAFHDILDFEIQEIKNLHTTVKIRGTLPEETGQSPVLQRLEGKPLSVHTDGGENQEPVFCGFIRTLQISREGNGYMAELEGISGTELLDREKKSRSFQDTDMTYKELVRAVLSDTPGAQALFHMEDRAIGAPVYQYEETDWEFLKRVASHLHTSLLAASIQPKPEFHFGLPEGKRRKESAVQVTKIWSDLSCCRKGKDPYRILKSRFLCRNTSGYERWKVGDRITLAGRNSAVVKAAGKLENSLLVFRCTVSEPEAFGTARYENRALAGISLAGTVLETRGESVRVKFDIDREQCADRAYWYPWMPETGNVMYGMPEKGERIAVTFDDETGNARGSRSLRRNGSGHSEMQDVSRRYFTTAKDKRMYLFPSSLGFTDLAQKEPLKLELSDETGVSLESGKNISILAEEGVWLQGSRLSFDAPQEISLVRRDLTSPTVINLCNGFDVVGKFGKVKMDGGKAEDFPAVSSDKGAYDLSSEGRKIMASTPVLAGATELERRVTGTKVDFITSDFGRMRNS